jgi:hypothetical protein
MHTALKSKKMTQCNNKPHSHLLPICSVLNSGDHSPGLDRCSKPLSLTEDKILPLPTQTKKFN